MCLKLRIIQIRRRNNTKIVFGYQFPRFTTKLMYLNFVGLDVMQFHSENEL